MRTANRMSRVQRLQSMSAALLASVLLFAGVAQAQQHFTLTSHVPPAVANGQAAWLGSAFFADAPPPDPARRGQRY
jgi:hypothetical protein